MYLQMSLADIHERNGDTNSNPWPSQSELLKLLNHSGRLFIYAATAIRYIDDGGEHYKSRLSIMANQKPKFHSKLQTSAIDSLYRLILEQACASKEESEVTPMKQIASTVIFLKNPLSIQAIASLSQIDTHLLSAYLSPLISVIHVPTNKDAAVAPFHASFPDFVTDPTRCSPSPHKLPWFDALVPWEGHTMLSLKYLECMNHSLKYNIFNIPKELTVSCRGRINPPHNLIKISEALKYSCIYWASHFAEGHISSEDLICALSQFLHEHLLHWIECLSLLDELQAGVKSLRIVATALSVSDLLKFSEFLFKSTSLQSFKTTESHCHDLQLIVEDIL